MKNNLYPGLIKKFGTPLFVLNEEKLISQFGKITASFKKYYKDTIVAYSFKTNYVPYICKVLYANGAYAEVIPGFEFALAKKLKIPGAKIIVNGPYKPEGELNEIINYDCRINVDNKTELLIINKLAGKLHKNIGIGIRLNAIVGEELWDKFGFNIESNEAYNIAEMIKNELKNIHLSGVHMHIGTNIIHPIEYEKAVFKVIKFIKEIIDDFNINLDYIDIGGGFPSTGAHSKEYKRSEWIVPKIEEYAKLICTPLSKLSTSIHHKPLLILEPGRYIVDDAVSLLAKVIAIKNTSNKNIVFLDAGVNIIPDALFREHHINTFKKTGEKEEYLISGPLCMQSDILIDKIKLPKLSVGDVVEIQGMGAYTISNASEFIRYKPALVAIHNGESRCIRRKETLADIIKTDSKIIFKK
ncbi:MAG: diaminopimelate decarboxylase [Candidatus Marsarchaeota archaeon]|nr:diaminopimelate decarboxylase [Candidatus Marsarchaeota archaeon]